MLKQVRLGYHADRVRVVLDLAGTAAYSVEPQGANLIVTTSGTRRYWIGASDTNSDRGEAVETIKSENLIKLPGPGGCHLSDQPIGQWLRFIGLHRNFMCGPVQMTSAADGGEKSTPKEDLVVGETRYIGRRISLDFQQADISNVLRLIAEVSGFNMVVGEGVKSKVTMKLVSVPWDQALDMILKMNGLGKIRQSNILWIDSLANISRQETELAQSKSAKLNAEELVDRVFYIRNLPATGNHDVSYAV